MQFLRLAPAYITHPKIARLSPVTFRLWHEVMAHCCMFSTDGQITLKAARGLPSYRPERWRALTDPAVAGGPLLEAAGAAGWTVHDFRQWNLTRADLAAARAATKARVRKHRQNLRGFWDDSVSGNKLQPPQPTEPTAPHAQELPVGNAFVPSSSSVQAGSDQKKDEDVQRVGGSGGKGGNGVTDRRRPAFQGQRFVVFQWQIERLEQALGPLAGAFDVWEWLFAFHAKVERVAMVVPVDDEGRWKWLQAQFQSECRRRGLPLAGEGPIESEADKTARLARLRALVAERDRRDRV